MHVRAFVCVCVCVGVSVDYRGKRESERVRESNTRMFSVLAERARE